MQASVDVIVPFSGSPAAFDELVERLRALALGPEDSLTIVDNTRSGVTRGRQTSSFLTVVTAPERQSSYYARNRGAHSRRGTWLLFLDADVEAVPDLIDRYLEATPASSTAVLCGAVRDVRAGSVGSESLASRYSRLRRLIDQANTLQMERPYAKTANCAIRRVAFEQVGGFVGEIRSGGDADLCFRLREAGWDMELRPDAVVEHRGRRRLMALLGQRARHGSGAEWLENRYPGFVGPKRGIAVHAWRVGRGVAGSCAAVIGRRDRDEALLALLDPLSNAAFDVGRRVPNTPWREQLPGVAASGRRLRRSGLSSNGNRTPP